MKKKRTDLVRLGLEPKSKLPSGEIGCALEATCWACDRPEERVFRQR